MANWLNLGQIFSVNADMYPDHVAFMDADRSYSFPESNRRINRLAHALLALGIGKGDTFSCLLENCIEICELYVAAAKIGAIINPINFRLAPEDVRFVADNAGATAFFVHDCFGEVAEQIRDRLPAISHYVSVGAPAHGYLAYEELLASQSEDEPELPVDPSDTWILLYTSGTTGRPKGVVRSHESYIAFYLINGCDYGFSAEDVVLTAMPLSPTISTPHPTSMRARSSASSRSGGSASCR
jgi:acyl-CoA synthetase (AMP-forming)/AMP-acid ligase II